MCAVSETRSQPHLTSVKGQEVKANLTKIVKFEVEHIGSGQSSQACMCDSENHCIQIFSWSLEFIQLIGTEGSRVGQLSRPHDLAVDSKGAPLHHHCGKQLSSGSASTSSATRAMGGYVRTRSCAPY